MHSAAKRTATAERGALLGVGDAVLRERFAREFGQFSTNCPIQTGSTLLELRLLASRDAPGAMLIDAEIFDSAPFAETLRPFFAIAPVILLAPPNRQEEAARLVAEGDVEYVARTGDFAPLAAALLARRIRWARMSKSLLGPPWAAVNGDLGTIFRHEINNPLTGILGNAELVLAHSERLSAVDTQRLRTVVDLAVRLRETIRRLSNALERRPSSLKPA